MIGLFNLPAFCQRGIYLLAFVCVLQKVIPLILKGLKLMDLFGKLWQLYKCKGKIFEIIFIGTIIKNYMV